MASAVFTINGTNITSGLVTVAKNTTVTLAIVNTAGVSTIAWSIISTHDSAVLPSSISITPAGSPSGSTATFTMPNVPGGQCFVVQCSIQDSQGRTTIERGIVGVAGENGQVPFSYGEQDERDIISGQGNAANVAFRGNGTRYPSWTTYTTTTNATQTTIATIPVSEGSVLRLTFDWFGKQSGANNRAQRLTNVSYYRNTGGSPTIWGAASDAIPELKDDATWGALDYAISGNNIIVRVIGKASTTIDWRVIVYQWEELDP